MSRLNFVWTSVRDSLWFVPASMTIFAVILAWAVVELDKLFLASGRSDFYLAFGGGVEGARGVLGAIAGTTITVTGVVFSVTIVALQLASSQFTPRVLRGFIGDRANQIVLGVFIGTFTYTLLVLRTVRGEGQDGNIFVPSIGVGVAILLALASVGFLIFFIHHAARSIQIAVIIDRATQDALALVDRLFPEPIGEPGSDKPEPHVPSGDSAIVTAVDGGYLIAVDDAALFGAVKKRELFIRMEPFVGEFILPGAPLVSVWPGDVLADPHVVDRLREAFLTGPERTTDQDIELALEQLSDIALRALSPSTNDPATAMMCIDRLAHVLVHLGNRSMPERVRTSEDGRIRFLATVPPFERAVKVAFGGIMKYGLEVPPVAEHLARTLLRVANLISHDRKTILLRYAEQARRGVPIPVGTVDGQAWAAVAAARASDDGDHASRAEQQDLRSAS